MDLWDGRFSGGPSAEMQAFSESLSIDLLMWQEDVAGSRAHATMLAEVGLLTLVERDTLLGGLDRVAEEFAQGWRPPAELEDVHMAVETRLLELVGPVAGKLHTARSRNDQVATDVRLWLKARLQRLDAAVADLIGVLLHRAQAHGRTLVPGYTHLQRGQPIWLAHQVLAHAWALVRDRERLHGALDRVDRCPLGAAALAGTPHPIDRAHTAAQLGFKRVVENAMDAVGARDHLGEVAAVCAILATQLSRMAEELVLWSSKEFGWIRLDDAWSTGSSIMPQKRNPDAAELVRGKSARVLGALMQLLALTRALPLAYNRDLQEDRVALFDAVATTIACTRVMKGCWESLQVLGGPDLDGDLLLATELADFLAARGVPFREAHQLVGRLVALCEERGGDLRALAADDLARAHREFVGVEAQALGWRDPVAAAERRSSRGGTAWCEVERQVAAVRARLERRS